MTSVAEWKEKIDRGIASLHDFAKSSGDLVMWADVPLYGVPIREVAPEPTLEHIEIKSFRHQAYYDALADEVRRQMTVRKEML